MFSWTARQCETRGCSEEDNHLSALSFQWSSEMDRESTRQASGHDFHITGSVYCQYELIYSDNYKRSPPDMFEDV